MERIKENAEYLQTFLGFEWSSIKELYQRGLGGLGISATRQALNHLVDIGIAECTDRRQGRRTAYRYRIAQ
jgi:hypothetical protein